jgi:rod shape-determining protein MreC
VHDKQVRRRRAVLGLLVAISLISLTAYFGESPNSPLHSVQRGIVEVLSPIQQGASTALKPVRDIAGWFSDTFKAKSQVSKLKTEVADLRTQLAQAQTRAARDPELSRLVGLDNSLGVSTYHPVAAQLIERDPTLWYQTIEVDKGTDDGVALNDPVIASGGLVGRISLVAPTVSYVTLITDHSMAVAAQLPSGDSGVLVPDVGNPNTLILQFLPRTTQVATGQEVLTTGFKYGALQDLYPSGIPIGIVSDPNPQNDVLTNGEVQVTPAVDLRHIDVVQILTTPHGGTARAQVGGG